MMPCGRGVQLKNLVTVNMKARFKKFYTKHGKKALVIFLVYFVTKWTLTIVFGAKLVAAMKGWLN